MDTKSPALNHSHSLQPFPLAILKAVGCWCGTGTSALIVCIQLISQRYLISNSRKTKTRILPYSCKQPLAKNVDDSLLLCNLCDLLMLSRRTERETCECCLVKVSIVKPLLLMAHIFSTALAELSRSAPSTT